MKKFEILDKKSRTSIMYGLIICLTIAIVFCIIKINSRPPVVKEDNNFYLPVKEKIDLEDLEQQVQAHKEAVHIEVEDRARLIEDNVNIRSGPGVDYERLGSAYKGFDYKILSGAHDEWIKIEYDGKPAFVFAEYVEVVPMFLNDLGEYEEYVTFDNNDTYNAQSETEDESSEEEDSTDAESEEQSE